MKNSPEREQSDNRNRSFKQNPSGLKKFICRCLLVYIPLLFLIYKWGGCFIFNVKCLWQSLSDKLEANSNMISIFADLCAIGGIIYTFCVWGSFRWKRRIVRRFLEQCDEVTKTISNVDLNQGASKSELEKKIEKYDALSKVVESIKDREMETGGDEPKSVSKASKKEKNALEQLYCMYETDIKKRISLEREISYLKELQKSFYPEIEKKEQEIIDKARQEELVHPGGKNPEKSQEKGTGTLQWALEKLQERVCVLKEPKDVQWNYCVTSQWIKESYQHQFSVSEESENLQKKVSVCLHRIEDYLKRVNSGIDEIRAKILERMSYM